MRGCKSDSRPDDRLIGTPLDGSRGGPLELSASAGDATAPRSWREQSRPATRRVLGNRHSYRNYARN